MGGNHPHPPVCYKPHFRNKVLYFYGNNYFKIMPFSNSRVGKHNKYTFSSGLDLVLGLYKVTALYC